MSQQGGVFDPFVWEEASTIDQCVSMDYATSCRMKRVKIQQKVVDEGEEFLEYFPETVDRRMDFQPVQTFEMAIRTSPTPTQTVPMAMLQVRGSWSSQAESSTPQTGAMKPKLDTRVGL